MIRYIDKEQVDTAINIVRNFCIDNGMHLAYTTLEMVMHEISKIHTADVVEVVRCKDCKHYKGEQYNCWIMRSKMQPNDYCSYGERREG